MKKLELIVRFPNNEKINRRLNISYNENILIIGGMKND